MEKTKDLDPIEYFAGLTERKYTTIEEFADWYVLNRMPRMCPFDTPVFVTDTTSSVVEYRDGQYQVELYHVFPNGESTEHSHPNMDTITIRMGGGEVGQEHKGTSTFWGKFSKNLKPGETHSFKESARVKMGKGMILLTVQKWKDGVTPTSASIDYAGRSLGPVHEALIKKHKPHLKITNHIIPPDVAL